MTFTQQIPAERLAGVDLQAGDTLDVVAVNDAAFVVEVNRPERDGASTGKASAWLRPAKGSVQLGEGETADDVRMDFHARKHGVGG